MMTQETLREAVARAICNQSGSACHGSCMKNPCRSAINLHGKDADAAIATMFERLRTPSEGMIEAGVDHVRHFYLERHLAEVIWQAMLAQFEKDNSDG